MSIEIWLIIGIFFITIEFSYVSKVGFIELGLGALSTSGFLYFYPESVTLINHQFIALVLFGFVWGALRSSLEFYYTNKRNGNTDSFNLVENQVKMVAMPVKSSQLGESILSVNNMSAKPGESYMNVKNTKQTLTAPLKCLNALFWVLGYVGLGLLFHGQENIFANSQLKDNTLINTINDFMTMAWKYYEIMPVVVGFLYGVLTSEGDLSQRIGKITKNVAFGLCIVASIKLSLFIAELINF